MGVKDRELSSDGDGEGCGEGVRGGGVDPEEDDLESDLWPGGWVGCLGVESRGLRWPVCGARLGGGGCWVDTLGGVA